MPPRGGPPMEPLIEALQLDESQTEQVEQILREQHDKRMALRRSQSENWRTDMREIHEETIARLRTVLSEDQVNEFIEFTKSRRKARHGGGYRQGSQGQAFDNTAQ